MSKDETTFDDTYVQGLLEESLKQLKHGPSNLAIKNCLRSMLELVDDKPQAKQPSSPKPTKKVKEAEKISAECCVCGLEREGAFFRVGFKCDECQGMPTTQMGPSRTLMYVPSCRNAVGFSFPKAADSTNEKSQQTCKEQSRPSTAFPTFELPPTTPLPPKYSVLFTPSDPALEDCIPKMRRLFHPCILFNYSIGADHKRHRMFFVQETATPILQSLEAVQTASVTTRGGLAEVHSEKVRKVAMATLQALSFIHGHKFVHGDLRPQNILVDDSGNVKIRFAAFDRKFVLPPPFCAPERATAEASMASDVYALGVSLSIIAFGEALEYPPADARTAEDRLLISLIDAMTDSDPTSRVTVQKALSFPYLMSVRVINGFPVETVITKILAQKDAVGETDRNRADEPQSEGSSCGSFNSDISTLPYLVVRDKMNEAARALCELVEGHGPAFQIITTPTHVSLYSVKSDPRRRRLSHASMSLESSIASPKLAA